MKATVVFALTSLTCALPPALCQTADNVSRLLDDVLTQKPNVRPTRNYSLATNVSINFHVTTITNYDTVGQKLTSNGWMEVTWINDYVQWDPADYDGVDVINPLPDQMWRPRITIFNTMDELQPIGVDHVVILVLYSGLVIWYPAQRFDTFCHVDVTYFPFDLQRCKWEIFVWGDDLSHTDIHSIRDGVDLDTYQANGEWDLVATRSWREVQLISGSYFPFLHYEVTLRRRPTLMVLTVLMPVTMLAVVNVFVFTVPSEAGERLAYSMTSLLSFGVFMSFILDSMPSSSESVSIVAVSLSFLLLLSAVYVLLCILSLRMFHRDTSTHPVPELLQSVVVCLEMLVCLDPPSVGSGEAHQVDQVQPYVARHHLSKGMHEIEVKGNRLKGHLDNWARKRKERQAAYTQAQDMTWKRVSRSVDKLFFRFFACIVGFGSVGVSVALVAHQYAQEY